MPDHLHQQEKSNMPLKVNDLPSGDNDLQNTKPLIKELEWVDRILERRILDINDIKDVNSFSLKEEAFPALESDASSYASLLQELDLSLEERLLLIVALLPHFAPETLTRRLVNENFNLKTNYPEFGGYVDPTFRTFIPSFQTALFLIHGYDRENLVNTQLSMLTDSRLFKDRVIELQSMPMSQVNENNRNLVLSLAPAYLNYLLTGTQPRPDFGREFPARIISTKRKWEDLILTDATHKQLEDVLAWNEIGQELIGMGEGLINPSFPCLFHGSPGTGKTFTAKLLGKRHNKLVFRVDLSMIVSKYIGETEKNLARLFDSAYDKDWILFFDEADALFSKRTDVKSSNDKWANLEVSYLLQRMEEHQGLTILATNLKGNLDKAMTRRFQAIIHFPRPDFDSRMKIWKKSLPKSFSFDTSLDMDKLAKFDLTGANISNIIKMSCLKTLKQNSTVLSSNILVDALKREMQKEDRTL